MKAKTGILIVQNDAAENLNLEKSLRSLGYTACVTVSTVGQAVEVAAGRRPALALIDLDLDGERSGIEAAEQLRDEFDVPVIYLTDGNPDLLRRAGTSQPYGYALKEVETRQLALSIQTALAFHKREMQHRESDRALRQTISELQRKTRIMDTILNSTKEGVVAADAAGRILFANSRAERIVGTVEDMKPGDFVDASERQRKYGLFEPDRKTHVATDQLPLVRALQGKATDDREVFIRNEQAPDGVYVTVTGRTLVSDGRAEIEGGVVFFRDMTREKEAEAELERTIRDMQAQAQLVDTVFESISDGVVAANAEGQFTIFNSSARRIVGMGVMTAPPEQWTRQYGIFRTDKKTPFPTDQLPLVHAMEGKSTDDVEIFIRNEKRPDGVFVIVSGRPLRTNKEGQGGGVITFRDVTNRKMAEIELKQAIHELRDQSELMEATFNGISDGLAIINTEGELLNVNPAGKQIAGFELMDPSQTRLLRLRMWGTYYYSDRETLIPPEDLPLNRAIFQGEAVSDVDVFVRNEKKPDGFFVRLSARPLLHAEGGIRGGVVIFRDVTDQILAEEARMQAFAQGRLEIIDTILHNIGNAINSVTIGTGSVQEALSNNPLFGTCAPLRASSRPTRTIGLATWRTTRKAKRSCLTSFSLPKGLPCRTTSSPKW